VGWSRRYFVSLSAIIFYYRILILTTFLNRTVVRGTETPGLFNYIIGSPKLFPDLKTMSDVAADHERLKALLKQTTGNREDIKWGEVVCAFAYT